MTATRNFHEGGSGFLLTIFTRQNKIFKLFIMEYGFALQKEYMDKKIMSLAEAEQFAQANVYKIQDFRSRCVDGRYDGDDNLPAIAKPGGDAGTVMIAFGALNKLGINPESAEVLGVVETLVGGSEKFSFHTDSHAEHDHAGAGMGCGHLKQAKLDPSAYGLEQSQIDSLIGGLPNELEHGARQEVLQGDHGEQAVMVVVSDEFSLKPKQADGTQAFVYQKTYDEKLQEQLSKALYEKFKGNYLDVSLEKIDQAVTEVAAIQLQETLKRLAGGLPVYIVTVDEAGQVTVSE